MTITVDDVRIEHAKALARLDGEQLKAIKRINRAFLESRFANCSAKDMMERIFEREADRRSHGAAA